MSCFERALPSKILFVGIVCQSCSFLPVRYSSTGGAWPLSTFLFYIPLSTSSSILSQSVSSDSLHQPSLSSSIFKYSTHQTSQNAHPRVRIRMQNLPWNRHPLHTRLSQELLFPLQTEGSLEQTLSQRQMLRARRDRTQSQGLSEAVRCLFQDGP